MPSWMPKGPFRPIHISDRFSGGVVVVVVVNRLRCIQREILLSHDLGV